MGAASPATEAFAVVPRPIWCGCGARNLMEHVVLASRLKPELGLFRLRESTTRRDCDSAQRRTSTRAHDVGRARVTRYLQQGCVQGNRPWRTGP